MEKRLVAKVLVVTLTLWAFGGGGDANVSFAQAVKPTAQAMNLQDGDGYTALERHIIIGGEKASGSHSKKQKAVENAVQLIRLGANLNHVVKTSGLTPLLLAIQQKNDVVATELIKSKKKFLGLFKLNSFNKVNLNAQDSSGNTALLLAIAQKNVPVVQQLLQNGANPNIVNKNGVHPLRLAVQVRSKEIVQALLESHKVRMEINDLFDLKKFLNLSDVPPSQRFAGGVGEKSTVGREIWQMIRGQLDPLGLVVVQEGMKREKLPTTSKVEMKLPEDFAHFTETMDAFDVYNNLHIQGITSGKRELKVFGYKGEDSSLSNGGKITFGAESEYPKSDENRDRITLLASPSNKALANFVYSLLSDVDGKKPLSEVEKGSLNMANARKFLRQLLKGIMLGEMAVSEVTDMKGAIKRIDLNKVFDGVMKVAELEKMPLNPSTKNPQALSLKTIFERWLLQTQDRPFSFLKPEIRKNIFDGRFPSENSGASPFKQFSLHTLPHIYTVPRYNDVVNIEARWDWKPLFGLPEKYIDKIVGAAEYSKKDPSNYIGWEVNFHIMHSYGEQEELINWYKHHMQEIPESSADEDEVVDLYNSPGHERMVFPQAHDVANDSRRVEFYKNVQAYVLLKQLSGGVNLFKSRWKRAFQDKKLATFKTNKGLIRLERDRWGKDTDGVEFRSGMKSASTQRFLQKTLAARVMTNTWSDLLPFEKWEMIPPYLNKFDLLNSERTQLKQEPLQKFAHRFGVDSVTMEKFFARLAFGRAEGNNKVPPILYEKPQDNWTLLAPLYQWEQAPYLSDAKKEFIRNLSIDLIKFIAANGDKLTNNDIFEAFKSWCYSTKIHDDIEAYIRPKKKEQKDLITYVPTQQKHKQLVDVNKLNFGIEFSARMPIRPYITKYADRPKSDSTYWTETAIDFNMQERRAFIGDVAQRLALKNTRDIFGKKVGKGQSYVIDMQAEKEKQMQKKKKHKKDAGSHGHGIEISFLVSNGSSAAEKNKKWRVEWDGIVRDYGPRSAAASALIPNSERGGHVELSTPRFVPTMESLQRLFGTLQESSLLPGDQGGGHINVDLLSFEGRPRAFARFMSYFHQYRGIMALMFQQMRRLRTAEPVDITSQLHATLKDFRGSEKELKTLLYKNRYFNRRVGRKTRYLQLDVTAYMQEAIPTHFINKDYDLKDPYAKWHPQFRYNPRARKVEFRMFDAPGDPQESSLQLKLVKALIHKAINTDDEIVGDLQKVDYEKYVSDPMSAYKDLLRLTLDLGLDFDEYKSFVSNGLDRAQVQIRSRDFRPYKEELDERFPQTDSDIWGAPRDFHFYSFNSWGRDSSKRDWKYANVEILEAEKLAKKNIVVLEKKTQARKRYIQSYLKGDARPCFRRGVLQQQLPGWMQQMAHIFNVAIPVPVAVPIPVPVLAAPAPAQHADDGAAEAAEAGNSATESGLSQ